MIEITKSIIAEYTTSDGRKHKDIKIAEKHEEFLKNCPFKIGDKVCCIYEDYNNYKDAADLYYYEGKISRIISVANTVEIEGHPNSQFIHKIFPYSDLKKHELMHSINVSDMPKYPNYNVIIINEDICKRFNLEGYNDIFNIIEIKITKDYTDIYVIIDGHVIGLSEGDYLLTEEMNTR